MFTGTSEWNRAYHKSHDDLPSGTDCGTGCAFCNFGRSDGSVKFYLVPNLDNIREAGLGNVIFGAMSQAFFTLSIGIGAMEIFGSYMGKERTLAGESINILILDTFVALMAGLIIIPACFCI